MGAGPVPRVRTGPAGAIRNSVNSYERDHSDDFPRGSPADRLIDAAIRLTPRLGWAFLHLRLIARVR